jgi:predicted amidohydrolase YtcJ
MIFFSSLGTDFPVEDISPIKTFCSAVFRQDAKGFPKAGFQMENALSREQAIKGMTIWAAKAQFEEQEKGSLEPGKAADLVILNVDLMKDSFEKIKKAKVLWTIVEGEVVFDGKSENLIPKNNLKAGAKQ